MSPGSRLSDFRFWLSAIPTLARQPLFFFGFTFLADAGLLALPVIGRAHRGIALGAGGLTFILVAEWIGLFAHHAPLSAALTAIVIFALLHAATVPASAWRPGVLPFTAAGTVTPFLLLILLIERVALWNPTPVFGVALILTGILLVAAIVKRADWLALSALLGAGLVELDLAGRAVLERTGDPHARLLRTLSDFLCRLPILLGAKGEGVVVGDQRARPGSPVLAVLSRHHVRFP